VRRARSRYNENLAAPVYAKPKVAWRPGQPAPIEQAAMQRQSSPRTIPKHTPASDHVPGLLAFSILGARVIR